MRCEVDAVSAVFFNDQSSQLAREKLSFLTVHIGLRAAFVHRLFLVFAFDKTKTSRFVKLLDGAEEGLVSTGYQEVDEGCRQVDGPVEETKDQVYSCLGFGQCKLHLLASIEALVASGALVQLRQEKALALQLETNVVEHQPGCSFDIRRQLLEKRVS